MTTDELSHDARSGAVGKGGRMMRMPTISPLPLLRPSALTHSTRSVRRGEIVPVGRGVYAPRVEWESLAGWERDLARVHAHLLVAPDDVLCLESAALLWGLPTVGAGHPVHVLAPDTATSRHSGGVQVHTSAHADRIIEEIHGIRLTSRADTCIDIARHRHPGIALVAADAAVGADRTIDSLSLVTLNEERMSARGRRAARWALSRADGRAESAFESLSRAAIEWWGFPPPELQQWIGADGAGGDRADMWWSARRVAGEADGRIKYDGRFGDPAAALRAREDRDRRLLRRGARAVVHWGWDDLTDGDALRALLMSVGLSPDHPPDLARLATLRTTLRARPEGSEPP
ncbi:hypothetical protein [Microbacterium testaceum]|uniref:hypothetical protein n=1 Tax=Microbacterium testaceum TaxID=2033 RepID=UPI00128E9EFF|nr:hypothetical protein [Microbacterium testaceum]